MKRKDLEFYTRDFREIPLSVLAGRDFIYRDPPYIITTGTYNDGKRGFHDWAETEEKDLYAVLDEANEPPRRRATRYLVSVGLNFVELGSFAKQNSMRWEVRSGKEIYNTVWFNTKSL
jgi:hypothetical protein